MTALAAAVFAAPAAGQTAPAPTPAIAAEQFPVGETLVYDAKFGLLTLGEGVMHIAGVDTIRGAPALHVVFRLRGGSFFYRLDDRMDSWIGVEDFASRRFVQDFNEGGSERYTAYDIYPDSGVYVEVGVDSVLPTSPDPLDDMAFFYFVRTVELEDGERYEFERYFRPRPAGSRPCASGLSSRAGGYWRKRRIRRCGSATMTAASSFSSR
jgi:hypothetical protein